MKRVTRPPPSPPQRLRLERWWERLHIVGAERPSRQTDDHNRSDCRLRHRGVITTVAKQHVLYISCLQMWHQSPVRDKLRQKKSVLLLWCSITGSQKIAGFYSEKPQNLLWSSWHYLSLFFGWGPEVKIKKKIIKMLRPESPEVVVFFFLKNVILSCVCFCTSLWHGMGDCLIVIYEKSFSNHSSIFIFQLALLQLVLVRLLS